MNETFRDLLKQSQPYADGFSAVMETESLKVGGHLAEEEGCDTLEGPFPYMLDQ